jgi:uncharacterized repeat protein (TIGR01451 family)
MSNVLVTLTSSDPESLVVPPNVLIPSGQSNALFDLTVPENVLFDGTRQITIVATFPGLGSVTNGMTVLDNDVHHFGFSPFASPQFTNAPFSVTLVAYDAGGTKMTWFTNQVSLWAMAAGQPVAAFGTNSLMFVGGQWSGNVFFSGPQAWVRLVASAASGVSSQSQAFDVEPPVVRVLSLAATDATYLAGSGNLWATISAQDSTYPNSLVEINPVAGTVTASYPIMPDATRLEQTDNGQYVYVVVSNSTAVRQFDLNTRQAVRTIVPAGDPPSCVPALIQDLATVTGNANLIAMANRFWFCSYGEIRVFDNGAPRPTAIALYLDPQQADLERSVTPGLLYGVQEHLFSRLQISAGGISVQASSGGLIVPTTKFISRGNLVYAGSGEVINPQALTILGNYPGITGQDNLVEVDAASQRTLFLSGQSWPYSHIVRAFDQGSRLPVQSLNLSGITGSPARLVRYGTNGLAIPVGNQLVLIESPLLVPAAGPADLSLSQIIAPDLASGGSNFTCTVTVSNRGPQTAWRPVIENPLPAPAGLVASNFTTGEAMVQNGVLYWRLSELAAGATATGTLVFTPVTEVVLTNSAVAVSRTTDTNFANNVSVAVPQLPATDLVLSQSYSPVPAVMGSNITYLITVSNAGPASAWQMLVTDQLPGYSTLVSSNVTHGFLTTTGGVVKWRIAGLSPGATATATLTISAFVVGPFNNIASVSSWSPDTQPSNNLSVLTHYVEIPDQPEGVFQLALGSEDILYDPASQRIIASMGVTGGAYSNSVLLLDPISGHVESSIALGHRPGRLARSDDGQFLYVSLPDAALVRRLTLTNLAQDLDFTLGGEDIHGIWYPFYAADLATVPGNPNALVAWRVRRAGPMAGEFGQGIAWFDNGTMRPTTTSPGGNWRVEFDTDAGTLFGYNSGDLRRCAVDTNGITFAETFPQFFSAGDDVEYGAGQLFSTAGRVIEYEPFRVSWLVAGAEAATLVEPDAVANRIYYLVQTNGWQLKVHELDSRRWLGTLPISNLYGTPTSLIRWGTNGLAFRTSSNQLFVIRTPFTQPEASADIAVQLTGPTGPVTVGEAIAVTVTVTNAGPAAASQVLITNRFFPTVQLEAVNPGVGSWSNISGGFIWAVPTLAAGTQATLHGIIQAGSTGVVTWTASAITPTPDSVLGDNTAVLAVSVGAMNEQESVALLNVAANDLKWSPALGRLLVAASNSTPNWAGGLLTIEPVNRTVQFETTLGGDVNRLAIADAGGLLHAAVDFGLNTLAVPDLAITQRYLLNLNEPRARIYDLKVLPGIAGSVVGGSRSLNNNSTWLAVYDAGIRRTNFLNFNSTGFGLEFGTDPTHFYYQDHSAGGFRRYAVQPEGVALLDTDAALLPSFTPITMSWADGHLFTSPGILIDPFARTRVGQATAITNNSAVCYDTAAGQAYYVSTVGSTARLQAIDKATLVATGSRTISGITGQVASLVRWGTNGLAFRTTGGQVGVLRTELIPSGPPTDLALEMAALQPLGVVGSNFVYSISVTNGGPNAAPNSQVLFRISTNATVTAAATSAGTSNLNGAQLVAQLGELPVGGTATVTVTIVPTQPGSLLAVASVTSAALDSNLANNAQALTHAAALLLAPGATTILAQTANDLAYNPVNERLYVSGAAGGVSVINPALTLVETNWTMPSAPSRLALSHDAQYLYAAFDAGRRVGRFTTASGALDLNFSLGTNGATPFTLVDFAVMLGNAQTLAVTKQSGGFRTVQILDDGVLRPGVQLNTVVNHLEFGSNPDLLYGTGMRQFVIGPTNLTELGFQVSAVANENLEYADGYFYTTGGKRVEAASRVVVGNYAGLGTGTLVEPDVANGRVYFLTRLGIATGTWQVRAYDPATYTFLGNTTVTNVQGSPTNFVRWGADGLAFNTTSSQVFLMRSPLAPTGPATDLAISASSGAGPFLVGSNLTITLTITNIGPHTASNVVLINRYPTNALLLNFTNSQGSVTQSLGTVTCLLGTLTNGASAQTQLTLRPMRAGPFNHLAVLTSSTSDPVIANNSTELTVPVSFNLGPDAFGIIDLQTADLAYDPVSGLLYATPTNHLGELSGSVVTIDPEAGLLGAPLPVGPRPSGLAISDDGANLYVLVNSGAEFRRLQLPGGTVDLQVPFSVATGQSGSVADEIKAVPQQPEALAAVLRFPGVLGNFSPSLVVYDNAIPRPALAGWQNTFEFFSPNQLMALYWNSVPQQTARIELTSTGLVARASAGDLLDGSVLSSSAGLIYSSGGSVFDPMTLSKIGSFGVSGLAAPDHAGNRVAILPASGTTRTLHVFDQQTRVPLGTLTLTNVLGTATRLLRCGDDRLAFRTSGGQVFVVRSSLLPSGPAADLAVTQSADSNPVLVGSNLIYTIVVTNQGPHSATNVVVSDSLPPSVTFISAQATNGVVGNATNALTWRINVLTNGGSESLTITVVPTRLTVLTNVVGVGSSATDSAVANNSTTLLTGVSYLAGPNTVQEIQLAARDMVYDPVTRRLYASGTGLLGGAGSSIYPVNPETGEIEPTILVGNNPGRLAVSDNGRYLHVGLNGASAVRRVDLQTRTADLLFSIGETMDVQDLVALSGNPTSVAVSRRWLAGTPIFRGVVIYDSGVARSNAISSHTGPTAIEPGANGSVLYGYNQENSQGGFYRMSINDSGVSLLDMTVGLVPAYTGNIHHDGGRIYTTDGLAINPNTLTAVGSFANVPHDSPVAADSNAQCVFHVMATNSDWVVRAFHSDNFAAVGNIPLTNVLGTPTHLVRCGADRLALLTSGGQLFLIRTALLPAADVMVLGAFNTNQVMAGMTVNLELVVSNAGPHAVSGVGLTNHVPAGLDIVSVTLSQGSAVTNGQTVVAQLGSLAATTSAELSLVLSPTPQSLGWLTNQAEVLGSAPGDPNHINNRLALTLRVIPLDSDGDGIPDDWELAYGLNPTNALDAAWDSDCDGWTNLQEYQAGRNPIVFENMRLTQPWLTSAGQLVATMEAQPGRRFTVETSTNLSSWLPLQTGLVWTQQQALVLAPKIVAPAAFFRLRLDTNAALPVLTLLAPASSPNQPTWLQVNALPGRNYSVQSSTNLTHWMTVANYFGTDCITTLTVPVADAAAPQFYRVLQP